MEERPNEENPQKSREDIISELRSKAREKFSDEEIDNFIKMGVVMASKPVLSLLIETINEYVERNGLSKKAAKKLVNAIDMPCNHCGYVSLEFNEIEEKLYVSLSLVDRGYKASIDIPSMNYANDLFKQYGLLKEIARAYWLEFAEKNMSLFNKICDLCNEIDFSELHIDEKSPTTMYFDENCKKRVGIFPYYVDSKGKAFYKKREIH